MNFKEFINKLCLFSCCKNSDKLVEDDIWKSLIEENNDFEFESNSSSEIIEI